MRLSVWIRTIALVVGIVSLSGCRGEDAVHLKVTPDSLTFGQTVTAVEQHVEVSTSGAYSFKTLYEDGDGWLTVRADGRILSVAVVSANEGMDDRTASIVVESGDEMVSVDVTQRGGAWEDNCGIELLPDYADLPAIADDGNPVVAKASIVTSGSGLRALTGEDATWYMAYVDGSTLIVEAQSNMSGMTRSGVVEVVNDEGGRAVFSVRQAASSEDYGIMLQPDTIIFGAAGGSDSVDVVTLGTMVAASVEAGYSAWLHAVVEEGRIVVSADSNEASERHGVVTVRNAEGGEALLEVVQYGAADETLHVLPESLVFEADGGYASCRVEPVGTGVTAVVSEDAVAWLMARMDGDILYVNVATMEESGVRHGVVRLEDSEGLAAEVGVRQTGLAVGDLSGTWHWRSHAVSDGNWNEAVEVSGDVMLSAAAGGYTVSGLAGPVLSGLGVDTPQMTLEMCDGMVLVVEGQAFSLGGRYFMSGVGASFASGIVDVWKGGGVVVTVSELEIDGRRCEVIEFPAEILADSSMFPGYPALWGEKGRWHYVYYENAVVGGIEVSVPVEYHRDVILWRPV